MEADESEYLTLPLEDRCVHKLWKARLNGYEECTKHFAMLDNKSPEFNKFAPLMKKFVTDSNAVAQEKALDAVLVFATYAHVAGRTAADVTCGIVTKCVAAPKKSTQEKALEVILMYCEIEKHEFVEEELIKGFTQKNPKVVAGCIRVIATALKEFGNKVIVIKPLVKVMGRLLEDRDKNVRDEAKKMVVEMYRWVGPALKPQLSSLKPIQIQELETEFDKLGDERPTPGRLLRSQQEIQAKATEESDADEADGEDEGLAVKESDPLDFLDPINILDQLPKDFYDKVEAKKWLERKEAMEALLPLAQSPKLEAGDYGDLVKVLKKTISKDSNVMVIVLAVQCVSALAKGLKKKFCSYAVSCLNTILEKFKEKKANVVAALREAADDTYQTTSLEAVQESVIGALNNKNPSVKAETAAFIARCFCYCTPLILTKKMLKIFTTELIKALNESDPNVRDNAADALGTAHKVVGEKIIGPFISTVDDLKMQKVIEYSKKAKIKVTFSAPKAKPKLAAAEEAPRPKPRALASGVRKPKKIESSSAKSHLPTSYDGDIDYQETPESTEKSLKPRGAIGASKIKTERSGAPSAGRGTALKKGPRIPSSAKTAPTSSKKDEEVDNSPLLEVNNQKQQRITEELRLKTLKWDFVTPRPEFILQLKDQLYNANANKHLINNMFHQDFKFHIKAIDSLIEDLPTNVDACIANLDLILRWLTIRFFDTNPSVILKAMDYLRKVFSLLSEDSYHMLENEAYSFMPYLIVKFGDPKNPIRGPAREITKLMCNIYPASKVSQYILDGLKSKNARQRGECLEAIGSLIEEYGMSVCQPTASAALKEIAKQIADRDNTVRNAALNALVQVYFREGEKVYKLIGNVSGKDLCLLEERIKRSTKNRPIIKKPPEVDNHPPIRRAEAGTTAASGGTSAGRLNRVIPTPSGCPAPVLRDGNANNTPASQTHNPTRVLPRPLSGDCSNLNSRIQIDYDFLEKLLDDDFTKERTLKLEEIPDISSFLNDEPMPLIKSKLKRPLTATLGSNILNANTNSEDNSQAINSVIAQLTTHETGGVIIALSQLDEVIQSREKNSLLCPHVGQILSVATLQYRVVLTTKMADAKTTKEECIKIYRSLTNCLIDIFSNKDLACEPSRDALHDLLQAVVSIILDSRLIQLVDDGPQVIRALNVLVMRIIEKAQFTNIFSAAIKLLHDSVGSYGVASKFTDIAMRCNWKCVRLLSSRSKELDLIQILKDILHFMMAYPSHTWADKPNSTPLRTIKTIVSRLVEIHGSRLATHLSEVPQSQGSELQKYIAKVLNAQKSSVAEEEVGAVDSNKLAADLPQKDCSKSPRKLSKSASNTLTEIFRKIGCKENAKEGLMQLYDFKTKNPEVDVELYLKKTSPFFQNYIQKALKKIETEKQQEGYSMSKSASSEGSVNSAAPLPSSQAQDDDVKVLVDQFKSLAAQAGFDNTYIDSAVKDIYDTKKNRAE